MVKSFKRDDVIEQIVDGKISRRGLGKMMAGLGVASVLAPMAGRQAMAADQAVYFTWAGYDVPEMFGPYIAKQGEAPSTPIFSDTEEALHKMRAGFAADLSHPCTSELARWKEAGVVQPIETSRVSTFDDLFPDLKNQKNVTAGDGTVWMIPVDWGNTSVVYRTDLVEEEPDSWGILWDERYKGRIAIGNEIGDTAFFTAVYAGVKDPYNPTDEDVKLIGDYFRKQQPLVRMYWSDPTEIEQALASGELIAASAWNSTINTLKSQDVPVAFLQPKEGIMTWVCGLVLIKDAPHPDLAYELIDAITSPETGKFLLSEYGYGHSNKKSFDLVSDETLERVGIPRDPNELLSNGWAPGAMARQGELQAALEEAKAGL